MTYQNISIELAEKSLLGTMLHENYLIADSNLEAAHFISQVHQNIFTSMLQLVSERKAVDYITLLTTREPIELGGANYLAELGSFASATKFEEYETIVLENWRERSKRQMMEQAQQEDWSIAEIQHALDKLMTQYTTTNTSIKADLMQMAKRPFEQENSKTGVLTGLLDLDKLLNGFQDAELTIIAARPSMGKTDTMNHIALKAGWDGYLPIIFSLEMSRTTLIDRLIAATGNFNRLKVRNPYEYFTDGQKEKWMSTLGMLDNANIEIDDRAGMTVPQIRATARKIIKANPDKKPVILIDYLQIIRVSNPRDNQTQAIGQISWDLKQMAKEFNCPVICLAQLNRSVEQRQDKRPVMSDLRDSGNIEQDADVIAFLYRDDYYAKESTSKNILEFIIAKHRNGPTGTVFASYVKDTGRLSNIAWSVAR
ncbi:replicative DNA helicase [Lysinibacillus varians]|uniref:DNA 5'-3' helicase n=1 Tax=Lysinibacillus varians TaxID=1145276 RepID=A0ABY2T5M0_9BACI|nr:replicative DNA helicase [Lysinibacillus varians]AHN22100.1 DNA helicase [Lysinibacillus varians]TKI51328.1 replicative DNA helicase [Lysinibacillus varians]